MAVSLTASVEAQAPPPPAGPVPLALQVLSQSPARDSKTADRRPAVEFVFDDPQGLVEAPGVTMTLDGADVTSFLQVTRGRVRYVPPGDLSAGRRTVQITLTALDGRPLGTVEWAFVVKRFAAVEEAELQLDLSATHEYAANEMVGTDPRHRTNANLRVAGRAAEAGWVATLGGNVRYINDYRPLLTAPTSGERVDVPDYLFTVERGAFQGQMGDVTVNESQLAAPSLGRRGVQAKLPIAFLNSEVHGFVTRTENRVGTRNGTSFEDGENRLFGLSLIVTPFTDPQSLRVHSLYIEGDKPGFESPNVGSVQGGQEGSAWTWGAASTLFAGRLQAEMENSWSRFDSFTGDDVGPDHDRGWRGQIQWADQMFSLAGEPVRLTLAGAYDRVGTGFRTVGNPGITADREGFNTTLGGAWRFINLSLGAAAFRDNVDLMDLVPRTISKTYTATLGVNPPNLPTLSLNYNRAEQLSVLQPDVFGPRRVNNNLDRVSLSSGYNRETWSLNLSASVAELNNKTDPAQIPDNRTWNVSFGGSWKPAPTFTLSPSLSFSRVIDKNRSVVSPEGVVQVRRIDTDAYLLTLSANWVILPGELTLDLQGSGGVSMTSDDLVENHTSNGSLRLSWNVEKYLFKVGKQVLSARSTFSWRRDDAVLPPTPAKVLDWGFFLTLDVFFPVKL